MAFSGGICCCLGRPESVNLCLQLPVGFRLQARP
jgi:hypothetical protein